MTLQVLISNILNTFIQPLFPIILGLAFLYFFWGLVQYLRTGFNKQDQVDGAKNMMFWGVIVITVMTSVWGIVQILQSMFFSGGVPTTPPSGIPQFGGGTPAGNSYAPTYDPSQPGDNNW